MKLPTEIESGFRHDVLNLQKEQSMPYVTSFERLAKEEGREEGRKESRTTLLSAIRRDLADRFGSLEAALVARIEQLDLASLTALAVRLGSVKSPDELRQFLPPSAP